MHITEDDLLQARTAWGDALIAIAKAYEAGGIEEARAVAGGVLDVGDDGRQLRGGGVGIHLRSVSRLRGIPRSDLHRPGGAVARGHEHKISDHCWRGPARSVQILLPQDRAVLRVQSR